LETIILASGSPRRQELLKRVGIPFKAFPPTIDEQIGCGAAVEERVQIIARKKIEKVVSLFKDESPRWVLGLDTLVEFKGRAIEKPADIEDAEKILKELSGATHRVYTAIGFLPSRQLKIDMRYACTQVKFIKLTEEDIQYYLMTGEWRGVAGAYRIQDRGAFFIESIKGSCSNVVGLPLETFYGMLRDNNFSL